MIEILVVVGFVILVAAAALFGNDSRDGRDWQRREDWIDRGAPHH